MALMVDNSITLLSAFYVITSEILDFESGRIYIDRNWYYINLTPNERKARNR